MHFVIQDADRSSSELTQRIANLPKLKHFYLLFLTLHPTECHYFNFNFKIEV